MGPYILGNSVKLMDVGAKRENGKKSVPRWRFVAVARRSFCKIGIFKNRSRSQTESNCVEPNPTMEFSADLSRRCLFFY